MATVPHDSGNAGCVRSRCSGSAAGSLVQLPRVQLADVGAAVALQWLMRRLRLQHHADRRTRATGAGLDGRIGARSRCRSTAKPFRPPLVPAPAASCRRSPLPWPRSLRPSPVPSAPPR